MLIVQKYGGTSLGDGEKMDAAARRLADLVRQGAWAVAVVSAQGDTTDRMIRKALRWNSGENSRETDAYLAAGEQMSAALLAMALEAQGCAAVSLTGAQAEIFTDGTHGDARILEIPGKRIRRELQAGKVVVVAGFQGVDSAGDTTTLGRGGSDTTAVALAAWLGGDRCQIFTDVDGIYDRDPRLHPEARRFDRIGYDRMLRLIDEGAQVLHRRSVELAKKHAIPIEVLSAFTGGPGTIVEDLESS